MGIKYIDNRPELGIVYDWREIRKEYEKLAVPRGYYEIPWKALPSNSYFQILSERSTGKTTNWLLLGLVMNKIYGTVIQYVRATENMLAPSHAERLVEVIRSYNGGEYIEKLTDGRYNSIYYRWKQFYYCRYDAESQSITEKSDRPIIQCLSIDKNQDYKSTYNTYESRGDLVIFDEFIGDYYRPNECIHFFDLLKTILRDRMNAKIIMLANTINLNSLYFEEFEISRYVKQLKKGDRREIVTERGTPIYIELVDIVRTDTRKTLLNSMFFGFKNPKLAAITGGELWAFECVPHILPKGEQTERAVLENRLYLENGIELLQIEFVENQEQGLHMEVHRASRVYDDSVILTLEELPDTRYKFGLASGRLNNLLGMLINARRVYFSSNEVGSIFKDYVKRYQTVKHRY